MMRVRMIGDPPNEGWVKLRVRSNGRPEDTRVVVVDHDGVERELLGVQHVTWWSTFGPEPAKLELVVNDAEVELEAEDVSLAPAPSGAREGEDSQARS